MKQRTLWIHHITGVRMVFFTEDREKEILEKIKKCLNGENHAWINLGPDGETCFFSADFLKNSYLEINDKEKL